MQKEKLLNCRSQYGQKPRNIFEQIKLSKHTRALRKTQSNNAFDMKWNEMKWNEEFGGRDYQ